MGLLDDQIRNRKEQDREIFEDSVLEMASVVMGRKGAGKLRDKFIITKEAIDDILKYYHFKSVDIPNSIKAPDEQLEYALRPHGIMYREITLSEDWYKNSFGPMIALRAEDGLPVVLLPKQFRGYYWYDTDGTKVSANKKTAARLLTDAICFYSPLPLKKIGISDLFKYMKDCLGWSDYALLFSLTIAVTLTGMLLPHITRLLSGFVLEKGSVQVLLSTAVFMLCVIISSHMLQSSRELAMARIQTKAALPMEAAMMSRLMNLPATFFRQYSAGELASRIGAINNISSLLLGGVFSAGITAIASLLYIKQIFDYAPALGILTLVIVFVLLGITFLTGFAKIKEERKYMKEEAKESGFSYAIISGIRKIRLSGAEKRAFARWAKIYAGGAEIKYNPPLLLKINSAILPAASLLGMLAIYYAAASSNVSPSAYLAFTAAYGTLTGALTAFADNITETAQVLPILEMAEPILQAEPEQSEEKEIVTKLSGGIELSNVSFRYNETMPYILQDLNIKIKSGEYVAIVGKTGCGKSTLMRLLLGFETPDKGAVYYDRRDVRSLDLKSLRRKIGVVMQEGELFSGSIFSNITVSSPMLTLDDAWEAAEKAGIADDIRAMPMGMHTFINDEQGGISGGQKQRLMIARAIAPKPKILLFDEATSALDNKTQKQVSDSLAELKCTRVVIAHRLSTVRECDRILVLDSGKIAESGSYDALIEKGGIFAELVERQRIDI